MPESSADDGRTVNTLTRRSLIGLLANRNMLIAVAAVVLAAVAGACGSASSRQSVPSIPSAVSGAAPTASSPAASAPADAPVTARQPTHSAAALRVLAEPAAGMGPIYQLITGARSAVYLTMYELADPTAEADLAADAARGVDVRVILDQHLERSANTGAYDYLTAHGVHARWGRPEPPTTRRPSPSMTPPRSS